jgi:hypothetical protein
MTADGVIVTGLAAGGGQTLTLDTDYTELVANTTGRAHSAHRVTAAITDEAIHTWSESNLWTAATVTYKQAAGGAATSRPFRRRSTRHFRAAA